MGRNAAIKNYDSNVTGQTLDLFRSEKGCLPVVLELLKSPWLVRASDLACPEDGATGRRVDETISVVWDSRRQNPAAFEWRSRIYRIDEVAQTWAVERRWWESDARVSHRCWRVLARDGTYDISFDRVRGIWKLLSVID